MNAEQEKNIGRAHFFDVDKLADIHVIIPVLDVRSDCLNNLADQGYDDVPPRRWQCLTREQLLEQRHHVVMISWTTKMLQERQVCTVNTARDNSSEDATQSTKKSAHDLMAYR